MLEMFGLIAEPALIALLSWWLGTGIIMLLVRIPKVLFSSARLFWTAISVPALYMIILSMQDNTNKSTYLGFISTIVIWGWHELAFLTGWISGSRTSELEKELNLWNRFKQSVMVIWHHELALLITFLGLLYLQAGNPNHTAICTFTLLWLMRLSSKLNLFFGVPLVGREYLPTHLAYLGSYFRKSSVSKFFYISFSLATITWVLIIKEGRDESISITPHWVLLATLLGLAIVEHALMVIPLSLEKVWGWALNANLRNNPSLQSASLSEMMNDQQLVAIPSKSLITHQGIDSK
jgi:hypothetical protein